VQLAIVSLAATVAINRFWFGNKTWGGGEGGAPVDQPHVLGINLGTDASFRGLDGKFPSPVLGIVVMVFAVVICVFVAHLRRTNFGQQMVVVRSNESAAASVGINVRRVKILAFGLSSFIAGVAGVMYAFNFGSVSANRFTAISALSLIAFAYIGGISMVSGAVIGGTITVAALFPYAWQEFFGLSGTWALLIGGVFLIFNLIFYPDGVAGASRRKRDLRRLGLAPPSYLQRAMNRTAPEAVGRDA
jgi:branched-chain amino acid transport system permease protein